MIFSLAVYGNNAFREVLLPHINNDDFSIHLTRAVFGFSEDVSVTFECVDGIWRMTGISRNVRLRRSGLQLGDELTLGALIHLRQQDTSVDILVMEVDQTLDRLKKYYIEAPCNLQIGSAEGCDIVYDFQGLVSRNHATLELRQGSCSIIDTSRNGIYMGFRRIQSQQQLKFGEQVNIFGMQILWLGNVLAVGTTGQQPRIYARQLREIQDTAELYPNGYRLLNSDTKYLFHRSPRMLPNLHTDPIEIESVPQPNRTTKRPLLLTIGPSMTMVIPMLLGSLMTILAAGSTGGTVSPYMYTGIVIAAAAAIIGVMWALINLRYSNRAEREAEENRVLRYQTYLYQVEEEITRKAAENRQSLEASYPPVSVCAKYDAYCATLWNRNTSHDDMMFVRMGLGNVDFQCPIVIPKKKFMLYDDPMADQPQLIQSRYRILQNVPVGIDLREHRLVGIVGSGNPTAAIDAARNMAVQLAANCCYTDLKMVFLGRETTLESGHAWGFARWLPHVWSENKATRFCAGAPAERTEVCFELSELFRNRAERLQSEQDKDSAGYPHYVIFVEDMELLSGESLLKQLLTAEQNYGVTTVILAPRREMLPNVCQDIIETNGTSGNIYNLAEGISGGREITYDVLSREETEAFARNISSVEVAEVELSGTIPDAITFLDMWGVKTLSQLNVLERWRKNRTYETMKALIGQKSGGESWYLDIHEKHHGPHGLVAGTTGSGKSETLQTFILSMALCYSPDDVAFFLIDYKGGGMANLFEGLPHVAGQISNLSGNQVHRAMVSIMSENRRRQRIFNECGVNHIDSYTKLYKNGETQVPLPHLLIIIDEFAELKKEESSFMRELISVAQVGRSLGVHLILATQKPSGTVDDNIWSNAKFRLCLRVQDRQDSHEMLHKADAAYITHPGRGFMQVGNDEIYEEFQSGWSGAEYDESLAEGNTNIASMHTITGKPAIVGNHLKKQQKDQQRMRWLRQLAEEFSDAALLMGEPLEALTADRTKLGRLTDMIYDRLAAAHVEYPRSRGNTLRLDTFAAALAKADGDWRDETVLQGIIRSIQTDSGKLPEIKGKTQLTAVVDYLAELARTNGYNHMFRLWLPVLPEALYLEELEGYRDGIFNGTEWAAHRKDGVLEALVGLSDNPANQIQTPYAVNLTEGGNLAVCGVASSGKSTFLQTMLFSFAEHYSPAELNFYILDYSNRSLGVFAELPHCGGVVFDDEPEKLARFFNLLATLVEKRKQTLKGGTYSQYVQTHGDAVPAMLIVVDNYAGFREKTDGAYETRLQTLAREGASYGIYFVISAGGFGGADIPNRLADNLRTSVALEMGDKYKYGDVLRTIHFDTMPETGVKGRGIAAIQGSILEFQTALALRAEDDFTRTEQLRARFGQMDAAWIGSRPRRIPEIPAEPTLRLLAESDEYRNALEEGLSLPYAYHLEDAAVCGVDLRSTFCWLITGQAKTGKSTLLQILLAAAEKMSGQCCVTEFGTARLKRPAAESGVVYVSDAESLFNYTKDLQTSFLARNKEKQALVRDGAEEDEIFRAMGKNPPIFLLISDLAGFVRCVYDTDLQYPGVRAFYENAMDKGALHNIYFIACVNTGEMTSLLGKKIYERMAACKTGIHLGGNVARQKLFDFSGIPFAEQSRPLKPGIGLLPPDLNHPAPRRVIIPKLK